MILIVLPVWRSSRSTTTPPPTSPAVAERAKEGRSYVPFGQGQQVVFRLLVYGSIAADRNAALLLLLGAWLASKNRIQTFENCTLYTNCIPGTALRVGTPHTTDCSRHRCDTRCRCKASASDTYPLSYTFPMLLMKKLARFTVYLKLLSDKKTCGCCIAKLLRVVDLSKARSPSSSLWSFEGGMRHALSHFQPQARCCSLWFIFSSPSPQFSGFCMA